MLRLAAADFVHGVRDSLRGFLIIHRLDDAPPNGQIDPKRGDRESSSSSSSYQQQPPLTTLALRRKLREQQAARTRDPLTDDDVTNARSSSPDPPLARKPGARKRVVQCVLANTLCIGGFYSLLYLLGLAARLKTPVIDETSSPLGDIDDENVLPGGGTGFSPFAALSRALRSVFSLSFVLRSLTYVLSTLCLLPFFLVTRVVNSLWFQDIANATLRYRGKQTASRAFSHGVADFILAILLETLFLVQCAIVSFFVPIPYFGTLCQWIHFCLLYSLYSFEYLWMSEGWDLFRRLRHLESHWCYFVGYGLPLTALTNAHPSLIISGALFGALFPFFLVSTYEAGAIPSASVPVSERPPKLDWFRPSLWCCTKLSVHISQRIYPVAKRR